jgi:DNA-binding MarR family transcriptional regulator
MSQNNFNLQNFLPYLLNQAAEVSSLEFQNVYKQRYGMLRTEWRVLFHLGLYGQMTASDIGSRAKMHKTKISRAVQRLTLTAQGRAAYQDLHAVAERYEQSLMDQLDTDEAAALRRALGKLANAAPAGFT